MLQEARGTTGVKGGTQEARGAAGGKGCYKRQGVLQEANKVEIAN